MQFSSVEQKLLISDHNKQLITLTVMQLPLYFKTISISQAIFFQTISIPRIRGSQIELIATVFYFRLTINLPMLWRERKSSKKREKTRRSKQREKRKKREKRRRRIKVFISYFSTFWFNCTCLKEVGWWLRCGIQKVIVSQNRLQLMIDRLQFGFD